MLNEHKDEWGGLFASWMQAVLEDVSNGVTSAFSVFVHDETRRCFGSEPALMV